MGPEAVVGENGLGMGLRELSFLKLKQGNNRSGPGIEVDVTYTRA